jgi:hypothetical protein
MGCVRTAKNIGSRDPSLCSRKGTVVQDCQRDQVEVGTAQRLLHALCLAGGQPRAHLRPQLCDERDLLPPQAQERPTLVLRDGRAWHRQLSYDARHAAPNRPRPAQSELACSDEAIKVWAAKAMSVSRTMAASGVARQVRYLFIDVV